MNKQRPWRVWRPCLFSAAAMLSAAGLSAETVRYEGFDSPVGPLHGTAGDTSFGWEEGTLLPVRWVSEDDDGSYHRIVETGLSWPGLPTVEGAVELYHEGNGGDVVPHRTFPPGHFYNANSAGHLWLSFLVRPEITGNAGGGGHIMVTLAPRGGAPKNSVWMGNHWSGPTSWAAGGERLYVEDSYTIADAGHPTGGTKYSVSDEPIVSGETAFLVMHFDFAEKQARYYINPDATADHPGDAAEVFRILPDFHVDSVRLWLLNAGASAVDAEGNPAPGEGADYNGTLVDEIRLGTTYADVAAGAQIPDGSDDEDDEEEDEPIDDALVFFELDADTDEDFWLDTAGLGWVYAEDYPWVYSYSELGWLYNFETFATFTDGSWFWDHNRTNWVFTSSGDYPWLWIHTEGWVDASPSVEE